MTFQITQPFRFDESGQVATTNDEIVYYSNLLYSVLGTIPGERVFMPTYGSALGAFQWDYLQGVADVDNLEADVKEAVTRWVPEVVVTSVDITEEDQGDGHYIAVTVNFETANKKNGTVTTKIDLLDISGVLTEGN